MIRVRSRLFLSFLTLLVFLPMALFARDAHEQARIDFLLREVQSASGLKFVRNGSEYDGAAAAEHLRMKLGYAGEKVKTAEEFVKYCASESSVTHRKYKVRFSDGSVKDAAVFFVDELRKFDEKH